MIKFSKPEIGDIRYLVFRTYNGEWWIQKVRMIKAGRKNKWFVGHIIEYIAGVMNSTSDNNTGAYYYWQFVDSEIDARKMLMFDVFDNRDVNLFYRDEPDLEQLI